jgi:hypothetical protein
MQAAYKERTFALHQALIEKNEKQDEFVDTRALIENLRLQLDSMAAKASEQEKAMQAMAQELEEEKRLRQQQQDEQEKALEAMTEELEEEKRLRQQQQDEQEKTMQTMTEELEEEKRLRQQLQDDAVTPSTSRTRSADEDIPSIALQTPQRGGKRASHGTFTSDSGFESGDNESVADSIFSQREGLESPPSTLAAPSPSLSQIALTTPKHVTSTSTIAPAPTPALGRSSTYYDRVMRGIASTRLGSLSGHSSQCGICHGVPASEAWSVMGVLKDENRGLKMRLGELELVIDDCLSMVGA